MTMLPPMSDRKALRLNMALLPCVAQFEQGTGQAVDPSGHFAGPGTAPCKSSMESKLMLDRYETELPEREETL